MGVAVWVIGCYAYAAYKHHMHHATVGAFVKRFGGIGWNDRPKFCGGCFGHSWAFGSGLCASELRRLLPQSQKHTGLIIMANLSFVAMQRALGVKPDGLVGRITLTALFKKLGAKQDVATELALSANVACRKIGVMTTPQRLAHFVAQMAHESGRFRYMEEIASGAAYEGRTDLGNIYKGDGIRYKGRGPIGITGRENYRKCGEDLGIDLEYHPELAAIPSVGMLIACWFWYGRDLNTLADENDIRSITRRINGGLNGFADRQDLYAIVSGLMS